MAQSKYIQSVLKAAGGRPKSTQWFRDKIKEFGTPKSADLIRDGKRTSSPTFGLLNMFIYDPKLKDKLPYYDTFPLVLPIENYSNGFLGINMHYLSMPIRIRLLDRLVDYSNNDKFDKSTELRVDYSRLKRIDLIKPCLKRYLASNVRTEFRKVEADEFMVATLLPVQRFKKQSDSHVFAKSRGMI
jgi:hypothetical protein|tara:strand:- start:48 stop:605 length:558 start_codon:yes stop_codon:yes gene_type:complete